MLLVAVQRAEIGGMLGGEVRAPGHGLLQHRRAQGLGQFGSLGEGVRRGDLVAGQNDGLLSREQAPGELFERGIARAYRRVDAGHLAHVDGGLVVQDVSRQRDEDRAGRRGRGDLGGAAQDTRQVFDAAHFGGPFHDRLGDRDQGRVEQGLGQPVALFLLAGGHDHRRARHHRGVDRADGIAEARRHVDVAGDQLAGGPCIAVGHGDHDGFLQGQHVAHLRRRGERMHDRQLGRTGVAEHLGDALVLQHAQEGVAAGDGVGDLCVGHSFPP